MGWSNKWDDKPDVVIGVDSGSPDGDKTVVSLFKDNEHTVIGESVKLEIPIKAGWELNATNAIQVGDLAVHKPLGWNNEYSWRVTHVPTLTMFDKAVPVGDWTDEQLIQWCWKVQQTQRIYFKELAKYNNRNYQEIDGAMLSNMCQYCLSISPGD